MAYIARQAATVGRQVPRAETSHWVPFLPGAGDACLGLLRHGETAVQGGQAPCVAIHPQGRLLLTGGSDGAVRCRNLATGLLLWG